VTVVWGRGERRVNVAEEVRMWNCFLLGQLWGSEGLGWEIRGEGGREGWGGGGGVRWHHR